MEERRRWCAFKTTYDLQEPKGHGVSNGFHLTGADNQVAIHVDAILMGQCSGSEGGFSGNKFLQNDRTSPVKIILTGPSQAGKSYLLYAWVLGVKNIIETIPTDTFNTEPVSSNNGKKFMVYDLGGRPNLRPRQRSFYDATQGIVLVVNSTDGQSIEEAKKDLDQLEGAVKLTGVPILVVANRLDSPGAWSCDEIKSRLQLESKLSGRKWKICGLRNNSQEDVDQVLEELDLLVKDQEE